MDVAFSHAGSDHTAHIRDFSWSDLMDMLEEEETRQDEPLHQSLGRYAALILDVDGEPAWAASMSADLGSAAVQAVRGFLVGLIRGSGA